MAKIVRCDRCGTLEPENNGYDITMEPQSIRGLFDDPMTCDLCCKCAADFKAFMRNEDVSRRYNVALKDADPK